MQIGYLKFRSPPSLNAKQSGVSIPPPPRDPFIQKKKTSKVLFKFHPWFLSPGWRLFGALILTLLLPTSLFVLLMSAQAIHTLKKQAVEQNTLTAQLASKAFQEHFQGLARYLESFSHRSTFVEGIQRKDRWLLQYLLKELVTKNQEFDRAFITDVNGLEGYDFPHNPDMIGKNFSFRDWYQGIVSVRRTYVSEIYFRTTESSRLVTAIATPVRNAGGDTIAYLVGQHAIENLSAWLASIRPPFAGSLLLIDQHGNLVSKIGLGNHLPLNLSQDPLIREISMRDWGSVEAPNPVTGERSLISYVTIQPFGWSVLSIQSAHSVFAPFKRLLGPFVTLTLSFLLGLVALHFLVLHMIRRYHLAELEAEAAYRASEERLRAVVETARDAIISANQFGKIVFWNKTAEAMFGYRAEEVAGKPLSVLMPERFREAHRQGLARFVATAEGPFIDKTVELFGLRKDGSEFPLEISLSHWMLKDEHYFTAIIRDVVERKRTEEVLVQKNRELERLTKELTEKTNRLQRFHNLTVDRELDMKALKEEVNSLLERLGQSKRY